MMSLLLLLDYLPVYAKFLEYINDLAGLDGMAAYPGMGFGLYWNRRSLYLEDLFNEHWLIVYFMLFEKDLYRGDLLRSQLIDLCPLITDKTNTLFMLAGTLRLVESPTWVTDRGHSRSDDMLISSWNLEAPIITRGCLPIERQILLLKVRISLRWRQLPGGDRALMRGDDSRCRLLNTHVMDAHLCRKLVALSGISR